MQIRKIPERIWNKIEHYTIEPVASLLVWICRCNTREDVELVSETIQGLLIMTVMSQAVVFLGLHSLVQEFGLTRVFIGMGVVAALDFYLVTLPVTLLWHEYRFPSKWDTHCKQ